MLAHEMPVKYLCDKLWIIMLLKLNHSSSYHLSYSVYKHYVLKIADPSSMQDVCHMNFVIDLTHCRVSVAQWQSIRVQNPKVSSSIPHGDSEFFLCPMLTSRQKPSFFISLQSSKLTTSPITNMMLLKLLILVVCRMCVIWTL